MDGLRGSRASCFRPRRRGAQLPRKVQASVLTDAPPLGRPRLMEAADSVTRKASGRGLSMSLHCLTVSFFQLYNRPSRSRTPATVFRSDARRAAFIPLSCYGEPR